MVKKKLITWLIFGVLFSVLPFLFAAFQFYGTANRPAFAWYRLWLKGELLLVSLGFAADAVGEALAIPERFEMRKRALIGLCVLVASCGAFGYGQMQSPSAAYDPWLINAVSLGLFMLTFATATFCKVLSEVK